VYRASGRDAGPESTAPASEYLDPWHGQTKILLVRS
jgi:hypothetical protein